MKLFLFPHRMMWKRLTIIYGVFGLNFQKRVMWTIFDRSWYGRVLVERVEGFCTETEWKQAYQEINEMEENFNHFGTALIKFWVPN